MYVKHGKPNLEEAKKCIKTLESSEVNLEEAKKCIKILESSEFKPPPAKKLKLSVKRPKPWLKRTPMSIPTPNAESDPWFKELAEKYQPSCDCFSGEKWNLEPDSGPFYTHLGVAKTLPELRKVSLI